jgi:hypothetical protein
MSAALSRIPPEMLEKLRRCLALGEDKTAFAGEADVALKIANTILEKYGLSRKDIDINPETGHLRPDKIKHDYTKAYWMMPWMKTLSRVPKYLLAVELLWNYTEDNHIRLLFIGTQEDIALAAEVYEILRKELLRISRDEPAGPSRNSFLLGCAKTLEKRSFEMHEAREAEAKAGSANECRALVVTKQNDLKPYIAEHFGKTRPCHMRGSSNFDLEAFHRGKQAGENINLNFGAALSHGSVR